MAGKSTEVVSEIDFHTLNAINNLWRILMGAPKSEKSFVSRLVRMSPDAKEEYLKIKGSSKASLSKALCLFLLANRIISKTHKTSRKDCPVLLFCYMLEALLDSQKGKRVFNSLASYTLEALLDTQEGKCVFNSLVRCAALPCSSTAIEEMVVEDKPNDNDPSKALFQTHPTIVAESAAASSSAFASSARRKSKALKSSNRIKDINVREAVDSYHWKHLNDEPEGEKRFLSRLKRISREAKEEYLNIKAANTPKIEGFSSSTNTGKSKASFADLCQYFLPRYQLPEGLLLAQSIYCAKTALAHYNNKHGTEYKLVEPLSSSRHEVCGVCFHCNFTATKLKKNGSGTCQPKLFYADFRLFRKRTSKMHCCTIGCGEATFMCCGEDCPPDLAHCDKRTTRNLPCYRGYISPDELRGKKNQFCAKAALDFYNERHGTAYKLVEAMESIIVPLRFGVYKFNSNFKAKLDDLENSEAKLFCGEFVCDSHMVGECRILEL